MQNLTQNSTIHDNITSKIKLTMKTRRSYQEDIRTHNTKRKWQSVTKTKTKDDKRQTTQHKKIHKKRLTRQHNMTKNYE